ncbi:MAG: hypothetical protein OXF73_12720 [Gammaproteobacteria bacterium]|nr:hypothetical protein [Gammaproteobacteria bacterium]MCY4227829.1 hypothetical protein [Gammaproteobacteria bacterium]
MFKFNDYDDIIHRHRFAYWSASRAVQAGSAPFGLKGRACKEMIEAALFGGGALFKSGSLFEAGTTPVGRNNLWNNVWNNLLNTDLPNDLSTDDPLNADWPEDFQRFMAWHREKRERMIQAIEDKNIVAEIKGGKKIKFSFPGNSDNFHGRAAKLINVYMKAFLFSEINSRARLVVHPPVDSELLEKVKREIFYGHNNGEFIADKKVLGAILKENVRTEEDGNPPKKLLLTDHEIKCWSQLTSDEYEAIIRQFHRLTNGVGLWKIEKFWTPPIN